MSRYENLFAKLKANNEGAFIPFVTLGDPDIETSSQIVETLIENGADALELGFPFSDPAADGPVIQGANIRALNSKVTPNDCFEMIGQIRAKHADIPIGLLIYANLAYVNGVDAFFEKCQQAGVDSVLIADVPLHESDDFVASAKQYGINPIFIATPQMDDKLASELAAKCEGYTYLLSRAGVTGTHVDAGLNISRQLDLLASAGAPPAVLGFGISKPEQVKAAIQAGAAGAISGSAVVKIIEKNLDNSDSMLAELAAFTRSMKQATRAS